MLTTTRGYGNHQEHSAGWTEERTEQLKVLWGEGKSASEVAAILGGGLTRNGVIGKVHRLKIDTRANTVVRAAKATTPAVRRASPSAPPPRPARPHGNKGQPKAAAIQHCVAMAEAKPPMAMPVPKGLPEPSERLRLSDVTGRCKWCEGDPLTPDHSFCGQPVKEGASWCPVHYSRVYLSR